MGKRQLLQVSYKWVLVVLVLGTVASLAGSILPQARGVQAHVTGYLANGHLAPSHSIDGQQVTWYGMDSDGDYEIFLYDGTRTIQLTNNGFDDINPTIDNGQVTWMGWDGNDYEIVFYDGDTTIQLTNNDYCDEDPQISDGQVTWWQEAYPGAVVDSHVYLYDGSSTIELAVPWYYDYRGTLVPYNYNHDPQIDSGKVVWGASYAWVGVDGLHATPTQIFLYDGGIIQLSDSDSYYSSILGYNYANWDIDAGQAMWQGWEGIFVDSGNDTAIIPDTEAYQVNYPQLDAGQVAFDKWDGTDDEIMLWDGASVTQLTDNSYNDQLGGIDAGQVVWWANPSGSTGGIEVLLHDGVETAQIAGNLYDVRSLQIESGGVIWEMVEGWGGGQICMYADSYWTGMASGTMNTLHRVWGSSSSDVFAVGDGGTILHYNGSSWSAMDSGTLENLYAVWGTTSNDVFAVGNSGTILRYDGANWSPMDSGSADSLESIWGSASNDIFVEGWNGSILHYDGSSWSLMSTSAYHLECVSGNSSQDVFVVGWDGTILHFDGISWSLMDSGSGSLLHAVWCDSSSDAFATGVDGTILHYDGINWSPMDSGTLNYVVGIWGCSSSDVFGVGDLGTILHYDGSSWSQMFSGTMNMLHGAWGSSPSDVFAVGDGGTILHYVGTMNRNPDLPSNTLPANGAIGVSLSPTLQSSDFSDPDSGDIHTASQWQITTTLGDYSSPVFDSGADGSNLVQITLASGVVNADTTCYWRVRHQDNHGDWSDWSAETSFEILSTPPVPTLLYPANGKVSNDNTPWLDWSDVTDPSGVQYLLQVDDNADFSSPVVNKSGLTVSSRTISSALPDGTYYWRVRAVDGVGNMSDWTAAWTFTVDTVTPAMPVPASPANGKATKDNTPWLDWSDVTDATGVKYQLQVDNNADFSSPVLNKSGITASSRTLGTLADGTYYWRVRAVDGAGNTSAWTAAWSFTVDIVTPSVPALLYPANGTVTSDTTPWLDWTDVTDATGVQYQLQVDNNADFSSPVVNKSGLTLSSRTLSTLASGTYYWRVMVVDGAGNASVWTSGWSFTVVI